MAEKSPQSPLEDKEYFGYAPYPARRCLTCIAYGPENCQPMWCGSVARRNLELLATSTGNLCVPSPRRLLWPPSSESLMQVSMPSSPVPNSRQSIAARKILESKVHGNTEQNPFVETRRSTGNQYGQPASPGIWEPYQHPYEWLGK